MTMLKPDPMRSRDLYGYGETPPDPKWPGGAAIAVNFNLNVEGGGESTLYNGDPVSEGMLNDIGVPEFTGRRVPLVESVFEYGSRRGSWRVLDIMRDFAVPMSVLGVARALEQNPKLARAFVDRGHEIVSHGYRWIDYGAVDADVERQHVRKAVEILTSLCGARPRGWMTGRPGPNTRTLSPKPASNTTATRSPTNCPTGSRSAASRISSFPIRTRPTTTVSTRTQASRPATTSSTTCATRSTCSIAKAKRARRSCCRSACTTA